MHNIPQSTHVTLHTRSGEVMSYPSLAEAVLQLGYRWLAENLGRQFTEHHPAYWSDKDQRWVSEVRKHYCILRDAAGEPLDILACYDAWRSTWTFRRSGHQALWNGEGPVPGTGRRRRRYSRYLRAPRTAQERRMAYIEDEETPGPRPGRRDHALPNAWDDWLRTDQYHRNWKRHRKTQWREC